MKVKMILGGLALAAMLTGCSEQTQQKVEDTSKAVAADVKENTQQAVDATKEAASGASTTTTVKSALVASDKMDTKALNVDTEGTTVFLRGSVPTEEQKSLAEEIAKNTVPAGTTVTNELAVGAANATAAQGEGTPVAVTTPSAEGTPMEALTPIATGTPVVVASPEAHEHHEGDGHNH